MIHAGYMLTLIQCRSHFEIPVPNTSSIQWLSMVYIYRFCSYHGYLWLSMVYISSIPPYPTIPNFNLLRLSFEVRRLAGDRSKRGVGSSQKLPGDASGLRSSPKLSKMLSWRKGDDLEINGNNKQDANTIKIIKYHNYKIMKESKRRLKSQNTLCKTHY